MAQGIYKSGEAIKFTYQAANAATGLTVTMEIFDETGAKDLVNFADVVLDEIGASGRYTGSFTPDAVGVWTLMTAAAGGVGKVVKQYEVSTHNIASVGTAVSDVGSAVGALENVSTAQVNTEVDSALADYDAPTKAELDSAESDIRGADADTLKTISDQIDALPQVSPPMVG